jgi:tRNA G18 (ribose-2'-O)-methylase SpoU
VRFTDDELTTALNDKSQNVQRAARSALRLKSLYREKSKNRKVEECKNPPMSKKTEQEIIDESINSYVGETDDAQDFVLEAKDNITHVVHRNKHIGSIRDNGSNFSLFVVHSGYKDPQFLGVHKTKEDALKELGKFHNIKNPLNGRFSNVH